jgi:hypothetical protein
MANKFFDIKLVLNSNNQYDFNFESNGELSFDTSLDSTIIALILTNKKWVGNLFLEDDEEFFKLSPADIDPNKNTLANVNNNIKYAIQSLIDNNYIESVDVVSEKDKNDVTLLNTNINYKVNGISKNLSFKIWGNSQWQ